MPIIYIVITKIFFLYFFRVGDISLKTIAIKSICEPQMVYEMTTVFPIFNSYWR